MKTKFLTMKLDVYHLEKPITFFFQIILYAIAGTVAGGLTEKVVTLIPRENTQQLKCAGLLLFQLTLISFIIVFLTQFSQKNLYAWLSNGWDGRLFLLTFFVAQGSISQNIQCVADIHYN
jgi:hypothetical protein